MVGDSRIKIRLSLVSVCLVALFFFFPAATLRAEDGHLKGSVSGTVLDPSGAVIPGATVTLRAEDGTDRTDLSDEVGDFLFDGLVAGEFSLIIEAQHFRSSLDLVKISSGERTTFNRKLMLDPKVILQEHVTVVGSPLEMLAIPGSAHRISGDTLEQRKFSFDDIHKFLAPIPGIYIQEEDGFGLRPNIGMRGTGVERSGKITLMEDGVLIAPAPYAASSAYYFPTSGRMEALEVRKGSSQIRFGPQSNGGALNLISSSIPDSLKLSGTISGGAHGTAKGHARFGDSYDNFGWLFETYQIDNNGFKELKNGGETGFTINDYLGKFRFNTGPQTETYHELEIKLGKTKQTSRETYLGVTDADFALSPRLRYSASQRDVFKSDHKQYQARYFGQLSQQVNLTATVYRNEFARNWYKLGKVNGVSISKIFGDTTKYANELLMAKGGDSPVNALRVRANNRTYVSQGFQSVLGINGVSGDLYNDLKIGIRYHRDEEDRWQHEDSFQMSSGRMVLTKAGAPGSQANRLSTGRAVAFFVEDQMQFGRVTLQPGFRFENIELVRNDYAKGDKNRSQATKVKRNKLNVFVPGIGIAIEVLPEFSVFGGVNKGFGPPGPGTTEDSKAEESINYEGGFRWNSTFARVELVGFYNDYSNLLGSDTLSTGGEGTGAAFNGGAARVTGLEASASFNPALAGSLDFSLPIRMAYTFTDATFQSNFKSKFGPWGTVIVGDKVPYLPAHNFAADITVEQGQWGLSLSANYMSRMRVKAGSGTIALGDSTDSRFLLDLNGEYRVAEEATIFVGIQNLTDETYVAARRPAGARPGLPRTVMAGLRFNIGK